MGRSFELRRAFSRHKPAGRRRTRPTADPRPLATALERLESRLALAINTAFNDTTGVLTLTYDPVANQQAVLEIEEIKIEIPNGSGGTTTISTPMVNLYAASNAASGGFALGSAVAGGIPVANGPYASGQFIGVTSIIVDVLNYDTLGVNNNSLTIKGISTDADRIIIAGSGRSAGGRWSDEGAFDPLRSEVLIATTGIDNLTVTAGGVLNVSGSFTNDTDDASIHAIGQSVEDTLATPQTARVTIAESTPVAGVLPQPYLSSNFIQVVGASLDIYGDIVATDSVILSAGAGAPADSRTNLVLPFDITVTGNAGTGDGVVDLFSTKNIVQLQSSTIISPRLVAVSNASKLSAPDGPWMIDLGTATNDFDSISLGMVAAPGDTATTDTEGRIGVRDIDDLTVADFGILAATGQVSFQTGGALTFAAPITATGLSATSNDSIASLPAAVFTLGDLGLSLSASDTFSPTSTGDIALAGRININDTNPSVLVTNKVQAAGAVTIAGGIFSPLAGSTTLAGVTGVTIAGPIQVGSTKLDANSRTITVFDHDLICISDASSITVNNVVGNNAVPYTIQATNIISFDAADSVNVAGTVFAGTLYGNPTNLAVTEAIPAITIRANEDVNLAATGLLRTSTYETNYSSTTNPLVGLISITGAAQVKSDGTIIADGALDIDVIGDVYLNGTSTTRENISVTTSSGGVSVAGKTTATGATYTTAPATDSQRMPNVILSALNGTIVTGGTGIISAGTVAVGGTKTFGTVVMEAQQDIDIGAAIITPGGVDISTKLGAFNLDALLQTANSTEAVISAANGITELAFGRIVADSLDVMNTTAGDITLLALDNRIAALTARNLVPAGKIDVLNNANLNIGLVQANGDVTITSKRGISMDGGIDTDAAITIAALNGEATIFNAKAGANIVVSASDTVTLLGVIDSDTADVAITSRNRDLDFTASGAQIHARQGSVTLAALNGTIMSPPTLHAFEDVTMTTFNTLVLNNEITSDTGVIDLKSTSGSINLGANLDARDNSIRLTAKGSVTQIGGGIGFVRVLTGGSGYTTATTVTIAAPSGGGIAATAVPVIGTVRGVSGVITGLRLTSPGSGYGAGEQPLVTINRNATPPAGALNATAQAVAAPALGNSGLAAIDVIAGGSGYNATTTVSIAAPAGGGTAATAQAVVGSVTVDGVTTDGVLLDIVIVNPGTGYGAGEQPAVTISGPGTGAVARAIASVTLQDIRAGNAIDIAAGTGITLLNTIRADQGDVTVSTETGNLNLAARTLLVSSFQNDISLTARRGAVTVQRLAADGDITLNAQTGVTLLNAVNSSGDLGTGNVSIKTVNGNIAAVAPNGLISVQNGGVSLESVNGSIIVPQVFNVSGDISLKTFSSQTLTSPLMSANGNITLASSNGSIVLAANVRADDRVTLTAQQGISQKSGFIKGSELVARNATTQPVSLTNVSNDLNNVSIVSLGAVSYTDANEFETGVNRVAPLGVEVAGDNVQLTSIAPFSTIRVVSGLQYRTLGIAAGTAGGTTVGTVEFVTTSATDNAATKAPFAGTLRDMIRYANDNGSTYVINNTRKAQPMSIVFDEDSYLVEQVTLAGALPTIVKPLRVDGGRLEATATATRAGILGNATIPAGLTFGVGSSGSSVDETAVYGFTKGTGVVLNSANNTVTSSFLGLRADGTAAPNRIGLEIVGSGASGNVVGTTVFDRLTANRVGGNTEAGILIRESANGNRVFGNVIGLHDDGTGPIGAANGDGVRIFKATGNAIGTPDAVQPDLTPSLSNIIAGNTSSGVHIVSSAAGSFTTANTVRNNLISANQGAATASGAGAGIVVRASKFALVGGDSEGAGNSIVAQNGAKLPVHAIAIADSTDVRVYGNSIGVEFDGVTLNGNNGDGVNLLRSQRVDVAAGNVIVGNAGHGVAIGTGSTAVTVAANRIGLLSDDTLAGNLGDGVAISTAVGNTVGAGNLIADNANGVSVANSRATTTAASNRVLGSEIFANLNAGVRIVGGSGTVVGGAATGNGNLIRGNLGDGIRIESSATTGAATGHLIQGNFIGTNDNRDIDLLLGNVGDGIRITDGVQNTVSRGNVVLNNGGNGVQIVNGTGNVVGGATVADGNVISANAVNGVAIGLAGAAGKASGHRIYGNEISGNAQNGVEVVGAKVTSVWIGQDMTTTTPGGRANVITDNGNAGVRIDAAQQVAVQGNSIADNAFAGIQLANNANTSRATTLTLTSALRQQPSGGGPQVVVSGTLRGVAQQQYSIDLFASPADEGNPVTGAGYQGRRFIGRLTVTADRTGAAQFTLTVSADVTLGEFITATATSLRFGIGSTTAFSNGVGLLLPPPSPPRR